MTTKYLVFCNKRKDIHDIVWFRTAIMQNATEERLETTKNKLSPEHDIVGTADSEEQAMDLQDDYMLQSSKEYIPFAAEGLIKQSSRPVLAYITNKEDSNLVTYPDFYSVHPQDFMLLQAIVNIRLATTDDTITHSRGLLIVENLAPLKEVDIQHLYCVVNNTKLPDYRKLHKYLLTWELFNMCSFIAALKTHRGVLAGNKLAAHIAEVTRLYFMNDSALFQKMYSTQLLMLQRSKNKIELKYLFPDDGCRLDIIIPAGIISKYLAANK